MSPKRPLAKLALAAAVLLALPAAPAAAATIESTSSNWAGYAVARKGTRFRRVSGTWVQPAVTCTGDRAYSAYWVGLGGYRTTSQALEQIGTAADCDSTGTAHYTAWYELVPAAAVTVKLNVRAGDTIAASVAGSAVAISVDDLPDGDPRFAGDMTSAGGATPGALSSTGDAFSISFAGSSPAPGQVA